MENRQEFLKQDSFTKNDVLNKVLAANNYDGIRAANDLNAFVKEEQKRIFAQKFALVAGGATLVSLYNVGRLTQLSPSGKKAAVTGLAFFAFLTYSSISAAHMFKPHEVVKAIEEKSEEVVKH